MCLTLRSLVERFLAWIDGRNRPGTVYYYRLHLTAFVAQVGDVQLADLRRHHLLDWGRTWHQVQAVQRLFNWAQIEMELTTHNPFRSVKRPRVGRRRRVLDRAGLVKLLRAASPDFRAYLLAMRETIARPQEVRLLRWSQLRWDGDDSTRLAALRAGEARFELTEYKAQERRADPDALRIILVSARLGRLLARHLGGGRRHDDFVFTNSAGLPWSANAVRLRVKRLRHRAQLDPDARGENVVAYTLRHTSATAACAAGVPDRLLAEMMGHTSTRTTSRYQHPSLEHVRAAFRKLHRADNNDSNAP